MTKASLCSSAQINGFARGLRLQKTHLYQPCSVTLTRIKFHTVVKATSRVDKFSKSDIIISPSILSVNFAKLGEQIKSLGAKTGVVLNPATPLSTVEYVLDVVDIVLIMSVNPGFGKQSFIESQVKKISDLRRLCAEKGVNPWIEVDGGVGPKNSYKVIEAGANTIVAGSAVFGAKDYAEAIKGVKNSKRPEAVPA